MVQKPPPGDAGEDDGVTAGVGVAGDAAGVVARHPEVAAR